MAHVIQLGQNNTAGKTPDALASGEVAINTSDKKIWVGNGSSNTLVFNSSDYLTTSQISSTYATNSSTVDISTTSIGLNLVRRNSQGTIYVTNVSATGNAGFNSISCGQAVDSSPYLLWGRRSGDSYLRPYSAYTIKSWLQLLGTTVPTGGSSGQFLGWDSSGTAKWVANPNSYILYYGNTDGIDVNANTISLDLSEVADMTEAWTTQWDEFIVLDNSGGGGTQQKRKRANEIFPYTHVYNALDTTTSSTSTTIAASASSVKAAYDKPVPTASAGAVGGIEIGYTANLNHYPVLLNSKQAYVTVPWTDTTYSVGDGGLSTKDFKGALSNGGLNFAGGYVSHFVGSPWNHIPTGGSSGQFLGYSADGAATWVAAPSGGTTTWNGLENISNLTALP